MNDTDIVCPAGHYCPEGSAIPTPCLAGTYSDSEGNTNSTACVACDEGKYCNGTGKQFFII